jgi:hypothetical protein
VPLSGSYFYPQLQKPQGWYPAIYSSEFISDGDMVLSSSTGVITPSGSLYATENVGSWAGQGGGWRDIIANIDVRGVAASDPDWIQIDAGPFYAYRFSVNDEVWIVYHIDHDYTPGTNIFFHAHWIPDGTDTNSVKWQFTYSIAKGHNQAAFDTAGTVVTAEQSPPGTPWQHMITEISTGVGSAVLEPDCLVMVNIKRITNGAVDNADQIFLLTADCHYQSDRVATKNRTPDFNT